MQRRGREGLERRAPGHDPRPRLLAECLLQTLPGRVAAAPRRNLETEPDVVGRIGEQDVGGVDHPGNRIAPGVEGDDVAGHGESPPARRPEPRLGDQPGQRVGLQGEVARLPLPALRPAALVPAEGAALRHQHRPAHLRPPGELGILPAIADEGLVEAADLLVQCPRDPEILPGHRAEQVAVPGGQIAGARHVALKPGRVGWPAGEQVAERTPMRADRRGIDPGHRHTGAEAERQRIAEGVMPARMGRDHPGLRDHIAVEEDEDVVGRGGDAGVAGAGQPEPAPLLADHRHLERRTGGSRQRGGRPVVDHHHLQQLRRPGLPLEPGERERQRRRRLETGHDHADRERGRERAGIRQLDLPPVVVADRRRARPWRGVLPAARVVLPHGHGPRRADAPACGRAASVCRSGPASPGGGAGQRRARWAKRARSRGPAHPMSLNGSCASAQCGETGRAKGGAHQVAAPAVAPQTASSSASATSGGRAARRTPAAAIHSAAVDHRPVHTAGTRQRSRRVQRVPRRASARCASSPCRTTPAATAAAAMAARPQRLASQTPPSAARKTGRAASSPDRPRPGTG